MMRWLLWIGILGAIAFGSFYPFDFQRAAASPEAWAAFWSGGTIAHTSRGDVLGNVVLFLPAGFLGMLAHHRLALLPRMAVVLGIGFVVALLVQVGQVWLPTRDANLIDVLFNMAGMLPGILLSATPWQRILTLGGRPLALGLLPLGLIAAWLAYRLFPYVPSIDFQLFKDSLKPLLLQPDIALWPVLVAAGQWAMIGYLLQKLDSDRALGWLLVPLMALTFAAEVVIIRNVVTAGDVAGAALGLVLWATLIRQVRAPALTASLAITAALLIDAWAPFLPAAGGQFAVTPFAGFLGGGIATAALVAFEKTFTYGALLFALTMLTGSPWRALGFALPLVVMVEALQATLFGRLGEVTDILLVIAAAIAVRAFGDLTLTGPTPAEGLGSKTSAPLPAQDRDGRRFVSLD